MESVTQYLKSLNEKRREWEINYQIREFLHKILVIFGPFVKKIIPNFRIAHFVYITTMAFLGSVLIYPCKNLDYIDALFLTSGAATQAGLNTIDGNLLYLYQQIIVYIFATLTTPIFIHSSLTLVRLYWFERHFDNIKEQSKLDFKMRRSMTMASNADTIETTERNTANNQGIGYAGPRGQGTVNFDYQLNQNLDQNQNPPKDYVEKDKMQLIVEGSSSSNDTTEKDLDNFPNDQLANIDEQIQLSTLPPSEGIKFGDLPQPHPRHLRHEVEPHDMLRSIAMLKSQQETQDTTDSHSIDGHVLVIKSPNEIEQNGNHPIYTTKELRRKSFNFPSSPKQFFSNKLSSKPKKKSKKSSLSNKLMKTFSNDTKHLQDLVDEEDSIDSENDIDPILTNGTLIADDDEEDEDEEDEEDDDEDDDNAITIASSEQNVAHTHSNIDPKSSAPPVKRSFRRANAFSSSNKRRGSFLISPTFEKVMKTKRNMSSKLRRNTSMIFGDNSRDDDEESSINSVNPLSKTMSTNYLSYTPTVGRNSQFVHLTEEQKEELGGVEYRATKLLSKILAIYYVGYHLFGMFLHLGWINMHADYAAIVRKQGISPNWWACFTAQTSFNDLGLTLTYDSMISFDRATYILIVGSFLIVIGNTGFPILLRLTIWIMFKLSKKLSSYRESLGFLLDHPRRCFTLLFPSGPTWWLFFFLVVLNVVDLLVFIILDLNNKYLLQTPVGYRILDGLYQAFSTRTAGFSVVDLSQLHSSVQLAYVIMMYISVLPIAISIRRTNVFEEQSLGVYVKEDHNEADLEKTPKTYIGQHLRNQLSFDLWYIFLGLFIICIAENPKLSLGDPRFTIFSCLFEVVSAYGTVGLSLGYPTVNTSLSGEFTVVSKLVIIAMMIRGRHRGLPYALDRAIMLPNANMKRRDRLQETHAIKRNQTLERATSNVSEGERETDNLLTRVLTLDDNLFKRRKSTHHSGHGRKLSYVSFTPTVSNSTATQDGNHDTQSSIHH